MPGFLIRFLAWTKLAQAKLSMSRCIFNCSNHVYNSNFIVLSSANIQHCMNNIGPSYFTVVPSLITLLGQRAPSCTIGPYQKHCYMLIAYHIFMISMPEIQRYSFLVTFQEKITINILPMSLE